MKFLVVGAWHWSWYQKALAQALTDLGHDVRGFGWAGLFLRGVDDELRARPRSFWARAQQRIGWGPLVTQLNEHVVKIAVEFKPDVLLGYNATLLLPSTLERIRRGSPRTLLTQYANDNPFSRDADWLLWRHLKKSIPLYDVHFAYRYSNLEDLRRHGCSEAHLLRSYYVPETDFRVDLGAGDDRFRSDVVFAGHYEEDGRADYLEAVAGLGVDFKLFGGGWEPFAARAPHSRLARFLPVRSLSRGDYRKAISGTKIALCFLSGLNGDTYTRRTFEIPAMQTFMLSQYTPDLASLYEEGRDVEFFRNETELLQKVRYYLQHDSAREAIAQNGYRRLLRDGHDVSSRARQVVQVVGAKRRRDVGDQSGNQGGPLRAAQHTRQIE